MNYESQSRIEDKKHILTGSLFLLMFAYAVSMTIIGPMMPILIKEYSLKLSQGGLIITFQSIGGILAILAGGIIADLVRKSRLITVAFIIYTLSLFLIGFAPGFWMLLGIFFLLGASTKMLDTVINAFVADLHQEKRGFYLNLLHTSFGVGALVGPLYSQFALSRGLTWYQSFRIFGIICFIITIVFLFALKKDGGGEKEFKKIQPAAYLQLLTSFRLLIVCLIMFMYVGHQSGVTIWLPMYMEDVLHSSKFLASFSLSLFWIGIIIGRITCSWLLRYYSPKQLIQWGGLVGGILLIFGLIIKLPLILLILVGLTGLFTGATIPLLVSTACNWYPDNSGSVSSMIFLSGTIAMMIFPWFIGFVAEFFNFYLGMILTGVTLLAVSLLTFFIRKNHT